MNIRKLVLGAAAAISATLVGAALTGPASATSQPSSVKPTSVSADAAFVVGCIHHPARHPAQCYSGRWDRAIRHVMRANRHRAVVQRLCTRNDDGAWVWSHGTPWLLGFCFGIEADETPATVRGSDQGIIVRMRLRPQGR